MGSDREGRDIRFALTGDSLITRRLRPYEETAYHQLWSLIRQADASFTNLEGLLTRYEGYPAPVSGGTYVVGDPVIADDLRWAGFQVLSRANNHSLDWGIGGLLTTSDHLDAHGFCHAGVGKNRAFARSPGYLDTGAGRVALISAASSFPPGGEAGKQRDDLPGRPGLNPLRYQTWHEVDEGRFRMLGELAQELGLLEQEKERRQFLDAHSVQEVIRFAGAVFCPSPDGECRVRMKVNEEDQAANLAAIEGAARQADWVLFSLHSHESHPIDRSAPAPFIESFARRAIEAGADIVVLHGPHVLRGIEVYRGRPIFYSLGNFIFQNETVQWLPQEIYDQYDLPITARPDEVFDQRTQNDTRGFPARAAYWQTVLAEVTFQEKQLQEIDLYPVTLGPNRGRTRRGRPMLADPEEGSAIIADLQRLCQRYGTVIKWSDGRGQVKLC